MKKYNKGGQGYADREDESLGMRTGAERTKSQSMRDRRDESYGAFGKRPNQRINRKDGGVPTASANSISNKDAMEMAKEAVMMTAAEGMAKSISDRDVKFLDEIIQGTAKGKTSDEKKNKKSTHRGTGLKTTVKVVLLKTIDMVVLALSLEMKKVVV